MNPRESGPGQGVRWIAVLFAAVLAGCGTTRESTQTETPQEAPRDLADYIESWRKGPFQTPGAWDAKRVIDTLAPCLESSRSPVAVWVPSSLEVQGGVCVDRDGPSPELLRALAPLLGPCRETGHGGFTEFTWGDDAALTETRGRMGEQVPPLIFAAADPNVLVDMWAAVSGRRILYQKRDLPVLKYRGFWRPPDYEALIASDPWGDVWEAFFARWFVLAVNEPKDIGEFMDLLAAEVGCTATREGTAWRLVPLSEQEVTPRQVRRLLWRAKRDYCRGDATDTLVAMGEQALPELLERFKTARGEGLCDLTAILALIPAPERDRAFLARLEAAADDPKVMGIDPDIIDALADRGCQEAVPAIKALSERAIAAGESASSLWMALNRLGHPVPDGNPDGWIAFGSDLNEDLPDYATLREAVAALAGYGLLWRAGVCHVTEVENNEPVGVTFSGKLPEEVRKKLPEGRGTWDLRLSKPDEGGISVVYSYYCGPLWAGGYTGLLKYMDGHWLPARWETRWNS